MLAESPSRLAEFAAKMLPRFSFSEIDSRDPIVLILLNRYRRLWGLPPGPVFGDNWKAIAFDGKPVLVYADHVIDGVLTPDNICPARNRFGILAVYVLLLSYRALYDAGTITGLVAPVLAKNERMQRAIARVFEGIAEVDAIGEMVPYAHIYQVGAVRKAGE